MPKQSDEEPWWRFLTLCQKVKNAEDLNELFHVFLTFEEREALAKRYLIVRELLKGQKTQRELAADHKVSIAKITRGSNELKQTDAKLRKFLSQHMT